jgi:very-short-patch-repair endonuclease
VSNQGCLGFLFRLFGGSAGPSEAMRPTDAAMALGTLPYRTRDSLLHPSEYPFYQALRLAVGNSYVICPKVSLDDIFTVTSKERYQTYQNKIDRKHIDFLLCDPASLRPVAGIELDGSSHERPRQQERDQYKNLVFASCGLPLIRFQVEQSYDPRAIWARIQQAAAGRITYEQAPARAKESGPVSPTPIAGGRKPNK